MGSGREGLLDKFGLLFLVPSGRSGGGAGAFGAANVRG